MAPQDVFNFNGKIRGIEILKKIKDINNPVNQVKRDFQELSTVATGQDEHFSKIRGKLSPKRNSNT